MNQIHKTQEVHELMKAIRKQARLSQIQVAKFLNVEQSAYSRIESGKQKLSAEQWFYFCELTQIPPDAAMFGYVDSLRPLGLTYRDQGNLLPERYRFERHSTLRQQLPIIHFGKTVLGRKQWDQYLKSHQVNPELFLHIDNTVNLNFELDLTKELIKQGKLDRKNVSSVLSKSWLPEFHGQLCFQYQELKKPLERTKAWISNQRFYETNFNYKILEESENHLDVAISPRPKLDQFNYRDDEILEDFLCKYRKEYIKGFSQDEIPSPVIQISELECHYKAGSQCIYHITI